MAGAGQKYGAAEKNYGNNMAAQELRRLDRGRAHNQVGELVTLRCAGAIVFAMAALLSPHVVAQQIRGLARVVNGDTLAVYGTLLSLYGIDAPEGATLPREGRLWRRNDGVPCAIDRWAHRPMQAGGYPSI